MPGKRAQYDLIVCGGGMVGASLVVALQSAAEQFGLRIALVEQNRLPEVANPEYQPSFDARSTALAAGSRTLLESMGVWAELSEHLTPINEIEVSAKGQFGQTRMQAKQEQVPALGYVVENHWMGQVLMGLIQRRKSKNIQLLSPANVVSISPAKPLSEVVSMLMERLRHSARPLSLWPMAGALNCDQRWLSTIARRITINTRWLPM